MNWNPDIGIPLAIAGILALIALAIFGRPRDKSSQGHRVDGKRPARDEGGRREPRLHTDALRDTDEAVDADSDFEPNFDADDTSAETDEQRGRRTEEAPSRIVSLFVAARGDTLIDGASIVVAAEKAGLVYGDMGIFHRLVEGQPDEEPIFSVANMVKPGHFDLRHVHDIETPGLTFFMTLPGPVSALDAWEAMLPTAQRMAELLDAVVLDEERNGLGRQRIAHIRNDLRNFDREQEKAANRPW